MSWFIELTIFSLVSHFEWTHGWKNHEEEIIIFFFRSHFSSPFSQQRDLPTGTDNGTTKTVFPLDRLKGIASYVLFCIYREYTCKKECLIVSIIAKKRALLFSIICVLMKKGRKNNKRKNGWFHKKSSASLKGATNHGSSIRHRRRHLYHVIPVASYEKNSEKSKSILTVRAAVVGQKKIVKAWLFSLF